MKFNSTSSIPIARSSCGLATPSVSTLDHEPSIKPLMDILSLISIADAEETILIAANKANSLFFRVVCLFVCLVNLKSPPRGRN